MPRRRGQLVEQLKDFCKINGDKKGLCQRAKLQDLCGGDCDYCYGGKNQILLCRLRTKGTPSPTKNDHLRFINFFSLKFYKKGKKI